MLELLHRKKCNIYTDYTKFKQNEPPYELHHMFVMIAYSQNIADQYSRCFKKYLIFALIFIFLELNQ